LFDKHNKFIAIDLDGNAGTTAKILGAVFDKESVSNKSYVGIGLNFLDTGWTYDNLAALALDAAGAKTNDQIVSLLWTNVIGTKPTAADKQPFIALLENGMTAGALAHLAADTSFNTTNCRVTRHLISASIHEHGQPAELKLKTAIHTHRTNTTEANSNPRPQTLFKSSNN
jgi:hypothetical protein